MRLSERTHWPPNHSWQRRAYQGRSRVLLTHPRSRQRPRLCPLSNDRCAQEDVIERLKNGVGLRVGGLMSEWGLRGQGLVGLDVQSMVRTLCRIVRTGRRVVYRILGCNEYLTLGSITLSPARCQTAFSQPLWRPASLFSIYFSCPPT